VTGNAATRYLSIWTKSSFNHRQMPRCCTHTSPINRRFLYHVGSTKQLKSNQIRKSDPNLVPSTRSNSHSTYPRPIDMPIDHQDLLYPHPHAFQIPVVHLAPDEISELFARNKPRTPERDRIHIHLLLLPTRGIKRIPAPPKHSTSHCDPPTRGLSKYPVPAPSQLSPRRFQASHRRRPSTRLAVAALPVYG
jgi:hypothetical protein